MNRRRNSLSISRSLTMDKTLPSNPPRQGPAAAPSNPSPPSSLSSGSIRPAWELYPGE
ncbi:hypothetical protein [Heliophilum fasciatum]|uniref:hypothetical protein n=1 Tax=Heliophilum fasciatum TaxID=35700 RepID=UPI0014051727|nr:hypothetical protein [Heliophilum fasciatum]MCW2277357.1 hypothetical protein [Heliophilum fasciatum]